MRYLYIFLLLLVSFHSLTQKSSDVELRYIGALNEIREILIEDSEFNISEIKSLLTRWQEMEPDSSTLANMLQLIAFDIEIYNQSYLNTFMHLKKHYPSSRFTTSISEFDLRTIHEHSALLELLHLKFLNDQSPYSIRVNENWISEYAFFNIEENDKIAEIGFGTGWFTLITSKMYPNVMIHANEIDIQKVKYLDKVISTLSKTNKNRNIVTVTGDNKNTNLPEGKFSKIILRKTFHHFKKPRAMMKSIQDGLDKKGKIYIMEPVLNESQSSLCPDTLPREKIMRIIKNSGFSVSNSFEAQDWYILEIEKR